MDEQHVLEHLLALKQELEQLGCRVTITSEAGDEPLTIEIAYPPDLGDDAKDWDC